MSTSKSSFISFEIEPTKANSFFFVCEADLETLMLFVS